MKKLFRIQICLILMALSACNMPTETISDAPQGFVFGTWNCSYLENGFYAAVPLTMNQNGTAEFQYKQGTWAFDSQANIFTFSSDVPIQNAMYSSENQTLELTLAAGQTVGGKTNISCTAPQALSIRINPIVIRYPFNERAFLAEEIASVISRHKQTRNGNNILQYSVWQTEIPFTSQVSGQICLRHILNSRSGIGKIYESNGGKYEIQY